MNYELVQWPSFKKELWLELVKMCACYLLENIFETKLFMNSLHCLVNASVSAS